MSLHLYLILPFEHCLRTPEGNFQNKCGNCALQSDTSPYFAHFTTFYQLHTRQHTHLHACFLLRTGMKQGICCARAAAAFRKRGCEQAANEACDDIHIFRALAQFHIPAGPDLLNSSLQWSRLHVHIHMLFTCHGSIERIQKHVLASVAACTPAGSYGSASNMCLRAIKPRR
eukprot:972865-Pelagomonas_calceolata.AAC.3